MTNGPLLNLHSAADGRLTPIRGFYAGSERSEKQEAAGLMGLS